MKRPGIGAALHVGETTTGIVIVVTDREGVVGSDGRRSEETRMTTENAGRRDLREAIGSVRLHRDGRRQPRLSRTSLGWQTNLGWQINLGLRRRAQRRRIRILPKHLSELLHSHQLL